MKRYTVWSMTTDPLIIASMFSDQAAIDLIFHPEQTFFPKAQLYTGPFVHEVTVLSRSRRNG